MTSYSYTNVGSRYRTHADRTAIRLSRQKSNNMYQSRGMLFSARLDSSVELHTVMDLVHEDQQSIFEVCRIVGKISNVPELNTY